MSSILRTTKEEGHYTIKRLDRLPKRGNYNILYALKTIPLDRFYKYEQDGTYEEILLGGGTLIERTSELINDGSDGTSVYVEGDELASVATTGDYNDLINLPTIPTQGILSVVAGTNVTVDNTDLLNPIVSATGGGGGGQVNSVIGGDGIVVDATDPVNPIVNAEGLELVNEGGKTGWRLIGQDPTNRGDIGTNAIDMTTLSTVSNATSGAIGDYSFALGVDSRAEGVLSFAMGSFNISSGFAASTFGRNNVAEGNSSFAAGDNVDALSQAEIVVGGWNTLKTPNSPAFWNALDDAFVVGIGSDSGNRMNGLEVVKGGEVIAPELTISKIIAADPKVLATREYVDLQGYYQGFTTVVQAAGGVMTLAQSTIIPVGVLANDGDSLEYFMFFTSSLGNSRAQTVQIAFGGGTNLSGGTGGFTEFAVRGTLIRRTSTTIFFTTEIADTIATDSDAEFVTVPDLDINSLLFEVSVLDSNNNLNSVGGYLKKN